MKIAQKIFLAAVIVSIAIFSCKKKHKTVANYPDPPDTNRTPQSYVVKMGGNKIWNGTMIENCSICYPAIIDTNHITDTTSITVIDTNTIVFNYNYDTLHYISSNDSNETILFKCSYTNNNYLEYVTYYYLAGNIVDTITQGYPGNMTYTFLHTP